MTKLRELSELSLLSLYGIHKQKEKSRLQGGKYKEDERNLLNSGSVGLGRSPGPVTRQPVTFRLATP